MKFTSRLRSALAGVIAGTMLISTSAAFRSSKSDTLDANAAGACTINTNKVYQSIDGFGGINHPEWYGDLTDADRKLAFGNGDGQLGCSILRIFVNPDKSQWSKALPTAQYATKNGITVFASPWEPPSNLAENGSAYGGKLHLPKKNYGAYADHLNSFGEYMKNNGVDLYSVSVQNEPDYAKEWTAWSPDETTDFIANYGDRITSTRLMSPESFQYGAWGNGKDYYTKILNNPKAFANCDLFGTHFYGTPRSKMDFPALETCGKKLWMTEVYVPDSSVDANKWPDNLEQAVNIHDALVVGGMQAYVVWPLRRNYSIIYESTHSISKRGYIFGQFSKYIRPGDVRIDATEQPNTDILVSAYKHSDTQIEIVAINKGSSEVTQQFNVSGRNIKNVDRFRTSGSENLAATKGMEANGSSFYSQLPSKSVSTYIVTLESDGVEVPTSSEETPTTPGPQEPDANGYYIHDTFENGLGDWEGRGSATVTASGRQPYAGTEALLVQDRASNWNGAQKVLDPYTFKAGETYSFSVNALVLDSTSDSTNMMLSVQYKDSAGETQYGHIANGTTVAGKYVQLANTNYTLPAGASDFILYVETEKGSDNFYIDEAIVAVKGTKIDGPSETKLVYGDINFDGRIDVFDVILARRGLINGYTDSAAKLAADVDKNGKIETADLVQISNFVLGRIKEFEVYIPPKSQYVYNSAVSYKEAPGEYFDAMSSDKAGKIVQENYNGINGNKTMYVYLPNGYDSSKKYNVFYLMHGGGENEKTCFYDNSTHIANMLDHMIANGELEPMIVVTPTFNGCPANDNNMGAGTVWDEMRKSIIPYVEGKYSTYANSTSESDLKASRYHRAYGGFSMGGGSTWNMLINNLDICAYYMPLSGHCWAGAEGIQNAIDKFGFKTNEYFVFAATGSTDIAYNNLSGLCNTLKSDTKRFKYTSDFSEGNFYYLVAQGKDHYWGYVRHYIYDALPSFFHEGQ